MKEEKDWAGIKFKIMQEQGELIDMIFIRHNLKENKQEIYTKSHDQADGSSAFAQLIDQVEGVKTQALPTVKSNQRPWILKRFFLAIKHIRRQKSFIYNWKNFDSNKKGAAASLSYALFTKEETLALEKFAKENKMNLNSFLLWSLDKASSPEFLKGNQHRMWMVPVNIRREQYARVFKANHVTTLSIKIENDTPQNIYQQIKSMMKSGIIWGGEIVANIPKYIGEKRLRKLSQNIKASPYFGLCSNLGNWPLDKTPTDNNYQWAIASPVTRFCPVASVMNRWQGSLSFSILLHPSLTSNQNDSLKVLKKWIELLSKESGLNLSPQIEMLPWNIITEQARPF